MGLLDRLRGRSVTTYEVPVIGSDWPCWLTLSNGEGWGEEQIVVGESNYQSALEAAAHGRTENGPRRRMVVAQLVREPDNRYDRDAVRVLVEGQTVGYIPREDAPRYHDALDRLGQVGQAATCLAEIRGGWDRGGGDQGSFGIELACAPGVRDQSDPFLPSGRRVLLSDVAKGVEEDRLFGGPATQGAFVATLSMDGDRILVWKDSAPVGWVTAKSSAAYIPLLELVTSRGFPPTCKCSLTRPSTTQKRTFDAFLSLPDPTDWR